MEIQTEITPGRHGASRQTWVGENPRDLLKTLIDKNPDATEGELLELLTKEVEEDPSYLHAIIEYWFANNYNSLTRVAPTRQSRQKAEKAKEAVKVAVKEHIQKEAIKLLDLVMSNGKHARDNTFAFAAKEGGFWTKVSKLGKPHQRMGNVLTENRLQKLL